MHEGELTVSWPDGEVVMRRGDTMSVPVGIPRSFRSRGPEPAIAYVVRGSDNPVAPRFEQ